jgi:predicted Zn-dependent protease
MNWKVSLGCAGVGMAALGAAPAVIGKQDAIRTVSSISAQDKASGSKQHPELLKEFGGPYAGPQARYVEGVGRRIAVQSGLSNAQSDFTVSLLNSPVNNAFAIPGGYVYVTRQLMALMNDEAELAGVLGHEVGHVAARHGQRRQQAAGMLASLAAQSNLDARVAGSARTMPEWASTHPDPASRVARAAKGAAGSGSKSVVRNRDAFLNALDGLLYGDDPRQGVIDGNRFRHPDLRLTFTAPTGFGMENGADAVSVTGSGGQAQFGAAAYSGNLTAYIDSVFAKLGGANGSVPAGEVRRTTVNGLPAAWRTVRANSQSGAVDATVFAYDFGGGKAYHFLLLTTAGQGIGPFNAMVQSVQRLSSQEAAAIKPRRVDVVAVKAGDTVQSLSRRMAYSDYQLERFLTINALAANASLRPGQRVKIVTW